MQRRLQLMTKRKQRKDVLLSNSQMRTHVRKLCKGEFDEQVVENMFMFDTSSANVTLGSLLTVITLLGVDDIALAIKVLFRTDTTDKNEQHGNGED